MASTGRARLAALRRSAVVVLCAVAFTVPVHLSAQASLRIERVDGAVRSYTPAQLAELSPDTVRLEAGHAPLATYRVIPLRRLLALSGVAVDSLRGRDLLQVVVAEGVDGYAVPFTIGELSPTLGNHEVLVAFRRDGQAIGPADGPFRLLVPDESRASRAVRQLVRLRVQRVEAGGRPAQRSQRPSPSATKSSSRSQG